MIETTRIKEWVQPTLDGCDVTETVNRHPYHSFRVHWSGVTTRSAEVYRNQHYVPGFRYGVRLLDYMAVYGEIGYGGGKTLLEGIAPGYALSEALDIAREWVENKGVPNDQ